MNNYKCCPGVSNDESEPYLMCRNCNVRIHVHCLRLKKSKMRLLGDVFFMYMCENCSATNEDEVTRDKISWLTVVVLTLYNLDKKSHGLSKNGYFHWKIHICNFIDKYWDFFFNPSVKRKKNWVGTISSTLSHFSPTYFTSGTDKLKESGWWKLTLPLSPHTIIEQYNNYCKEKKKMESHSTKSRETCVRVKELVTPSQTPFMKVKELGPSSSPVSSSAGESSLSTFDDASSVEMNTFDSALPWNWALLPDSSDPYSDTSYLTQSQDTSLDSLFFDMSKEQEMDLDIDVESNEDPLNIHGSNTLDMSGFLSDNSMMPRVLKDEVVIKEEQVDVLYNEEISYSEEDWEHLKPLPGLFTPRDPSTEDPWNVKSEKAKQHPEVRCLPMSEYEELQLLGQLRKVPNMNEAPGAVRRLYRKLCVRRIKRERGIPLFNCDMERAVSSLPNTQDRNDETTRILDRFQQSPLKPSSVASVRNVSFYSRLMGTSKPASFYSPYTHRLLKPFIRRDTETSPLWLQLMQQMLIKANKNNPNWKLPPRAPLDYSYVRPDHIPIINSLAREFFYPGIDLTECLQYPDFSCVVLYKKLIVGFAFMVPDVGYNEAYISFLLTRPEWRKAGIASFMLYHLIQTCMGRDVTLHVSATNPAVILYQKFGFKVEEFVQNFYDKYFPVNSRECRHALFLRLSR